MDNQEIVVLVGSDMWRIGWALGFGAVGGGFAAVAGASLVLWIWGKLGDAIRFLAGLSKGKKHA